MSSTEDIVGRIPDELREDTDPTYRLPRRLIDTSLELQLLETEGVVAATDTIDGWDWLRPTVIAGRRYDWWQHVDGRLRLAPSVIDALEEMWRPSTPSATPSAH